MKIIGICGKARVGKDTCSDFLTRQYGYKKMSFASYLKQVAELGGWDGQKDPKGRQYLQHLGDVMREYNKNIFIEELVEKIRVYELFCQQNNIPAQVVISDVRLPAEIDALKKLGAEVWLIERDTEIKYDHITEKMDSTSFAFDAVFDNNGSFAQLYSGIQQTIEAHEKSR